MNEKDSRRSSPFASSAATLAPAPRTAVIVDGVAIPPSSESTVWAACNFSTGFYLIDVVRSARVFAENADQSQAINTVCELLAQNCQDEQLWVSAIEKLHKLCQLHPDAYQQSGTWYHGQASLLAMALAMEAATVAKRQLYPSLYERGEIQGGTHRVFRYLLRAMAQDPRKAADCLRWVDNVLH